MSGESADSIFGVRLHSPAASTIASRDAEAEQQEIIAEEEHATEEFERASATMAQRAEWLPEHALALAARGRELTLAVHVVREAAREARAAARLVRRVAKETRLHSIANRPSTR